MTLQHLPHHNANEAAWRYDEREMTLMICISDCVSCEWSNVPLDKSNAVGEQIVFRCKQLI